MADQQNDLSKNANTRSGETSTTTGLNPEGGANLASQGESAGNITGAATAAARGLYDQAKETAGQAYEAVTDKAASTLDEKKSTLSEGLSTVADSMRQVGGNLGGQASDNALTGAASRYSETAATQIENLANYFETRDVRTMVRDLEGYARRNPAIVVGAAFGLGMLAARFLKSSPSGGNYGSSGRQLASPGGSFDAGRGNFDLPEVESGQGLQMGGQNFDPKGTTGTTGTAGSGEQNLGGATTGGASTSTKKRGGSTKNPGSTRGSIGNTM